ncbi:MAG: hypothetical protein ACRD0C_19440 [Acidimicrobiia bacterium]
MELVGPDVFLASGDAALRDAAAGRGRTRRSGVTCGCRCGRGSGAATSPKESVIWRI